MTRNIFVLIFVLFLGFVQSELLVKLVPGRGVKLVVTDNSVRVRAGPCTDQRIITSLNTGVVVTSLGESKTSCGHTWWKISGSFSGEGWMASQFLRRVDSDKGSITAAWSLQQVGKGYTQRPCPHECCRLGPNCFDCSGLVYIGYKRVGINIPISTHGYNSRTMQLITGNPKVGDLLWRVGHVQIYIGNNQVVEAANTRLGVIKSAFNRNKFTHIYRPLGM
jgi:uncharacterized protein YgiM (DUF1202 family)